MNQVIYIYSFKNFFYFFCKQSIPVIFYLKCELMIIVYNRKKIYVNYDKIYFYML